MAARPPPVDVRLTVLGNSSRYLAPLGAGTSYLLSEDGTNLLLDCGNGTHLQLARELGGAALSGVLVSHFHVDHASDLFPVVDSLPPGTPLLVPQGALPRLADLLRAYGMGRATLDRADLRPVARGAVVTLGPWRLTFAKSGHGCPGVCMRVEGPGSTLVYLGDTGPRAWLPDFAAGADLLVAHTLLLDKDATGQAGETNLSAGAAGRLARAARVRRLALSHVPFYQNADESLAEAKDNFGGEVVLLREGQRLDVR